MGIPVFTIPDLEPAAEDLVVEQVQELPAPFAAMQASSKHIDRLRLRHVGKARKVDAGRSASSAIYLFCHECSGEDAKPRDCRELGCPLWRYRPGAEAGLRSSTVPTDEQYQSLADFKESLLTPEQREAKEAHLAKFAAARGRRGSDEEDDE